MGCQSQRGKCGRASEKDRGAAPSRAQKADGLGHHQRQHQWIHPQLAGVFDRDEVHGE